MREPSDVSLDKIEELETERGHVAYRVTFTDGESVKYLVRAPGVRDGAIVPNLIHSEARAIARNTLLVEKRERDALALRRRYQTARATTTAIRILTWCEALLPKRLRDEDLGDALEDLARFARQGRSRAQILAKALTTVLVLFVNGVREITAALTGRKSSG
jgi:hypothetical protein